LRGLAPAPLALGLGLLAGCALRGDVRKVELQVEGLRGEMAHADTARRAGQDSILRLVAAVQASLAAQQAALTQLRGDLLTNSQAVQQQLATLQELTGQSQRGLSELRNRFSAAPPAAAAPGDTARAGVGVPVGPSGNPAGPNPEQMYDVSLQQYQRGSWATARTGFQEFLRLFPTDERAVDALYYVGETFAAENSDSATAVYQTVVKNYPNSPRAPSALYKLGLLAEKRNDKAAARTYYSRVVGTYPRSDEANLARDKLVRLGH